MDVRYLIRRAITATIGLAADLIGFQFLPHPSTRSLRVRARTVQDPFCWQADAYRHQVRPVTIRAEAEQIAGATSGTLDTMTNTLHEQHPEPSTGEFVTATQIENPQT